MSTGSSNQVSASIQAAREKTELPGLVLLVVGIFNLLLSLWLVYGAIQSSRMSEEQLEESLEQIRRFPILRRALEEDQAPSVQDLRKRSPIVSTVWAVLSVWAAVLVIQAGLRMRALRSYGLVVMGALAACVPCVSCTGCCCLGQFAGLWAVLVLLNPEVRQAFR